MFDYVTNFRNAARKTNVGVEDTQALWVLSADALSKGLGKRD